jgi:hypothetical protein
MTDSLIWGGRPTLYAPCAVPAQVWEDNMTFPSIHNINHLYFVTASICGWKHLLVEPKYSQIVLDSLVWLQRTKRILLFAFKEHLFLRVFISEAGIYSQQSCVEEVAPGGGQGRL